jgi:hypothetical protein
MTNGWTLDTPAPPPHRSDVDQVPVIEPVRSPLVGPELVLPHRKARRHPQQLRQRRAQHLGGRSLLRGDLQHEGQVLARLLRGLVGAQVTLGLAELHHLHSSSQVGCMDGGTRTQPASQQPIV